MGAFESWRILYQTQGTFKIHEQGIVQFHLVYMADVVTDTGTVCIHEHTYTRARIPKLATRVNKVTLVAKSLSGSIEHALIRAKKWEQKDLHDRAVRQRVQQGKYGATESTSGYEQELICESNAGNAVTTMTSGIKKGAAPVTAQWVKSRRRTRKRQSI